MDGATQQFGQGAPSGGSMPQGGFPRGGPPGGRVGGMGGALPGGPVTSIVLLALFAITLIVFAVAFYKLYQKAGLTGAMGLLMLIPVVNLGVALYLAFAEWPVTAELARTKLLMASTASSPTAVAPAPASRPTSDATPVGA